ncbi:hypothetical protein C1646_679763 [Rhizophagus diaphanus]|nr:hypothetical protein C1646_679763 [Rhizophagus diaphanus] [Rhizophagus sp. MUCL 43196]
MLYLIIIYLKCGIIPSYYRSTEIAEELLEYFVQIGNKECFTACLYTCYDLVRSDVVLEMSWKHGLIPQYPVLYNRGIKNVHICYTKYNLFEMLDNFFILIPQYPVLYNKGIKNVHICYTKYNYFEMLDNSYILIPQYPARSKSPTHKYHDYFVFYARIL